MEVYPHISPALGTCIFLHHSQLCGKHALLVVTWAPQTLSLIAWCFSVDTSIS